MKIKYIDPRMKGLINFSTVGSACIDLRASLDSDLVIKPQENVKIKSGVAIHIKDSNLVGIVAPRSGLGSKGVILKNTIGVIDSDYIGEIIINIKNDSTNDIVIKPLDRIAQMMFVNISIPTFEEVDTLEETERGSNGFGSSGVA